MQDRYPQICVIDVAAVITGKNHDAAAQDFRRMSERYPDVSSTCTDVKFQDYRGRRGPIFKKAQHTVCAVLTTHMKLLVVHTT